MKRIVLILGIIAGIGILQAEAQFLKELKERALDRTKDVIIAKTADKAADKAGDAMDKLLNPDFGSLMNKSGKKIDAADLPAQYRFSHKYSLKMSTTQGDIKMDYYLNKTEPYMGMEMDMGMKMFMVFDQGNKMMVNYINDVPYATEMAVDVAEEDFDAQNDYTFTKLPNRKFLGYDCVGHQMENNDYKFIVYIAPDMDAGFGNVFSNQQTKLPPAMMAAAKEYENGLMMFMDMEDKKSRKKKNTSGTMECVAFEPQELVINNRK